MKFFSDMHVIFDIWHSYRTSLLFYILSVLSNSSKKNIDRLQEVQNFAARLVTDTRKFYHITPVLTQLNWLSVTNTLDLKTQ